MDGSSQRVQAADQGGRGRVQEFVGNAIDTSMLSGVKCAPSALANDFFQRHPVAGSAPGGNENVGISSKHILRRGLIAGCGDEFSTNCLNEFRNPGFPILRKKRGVAAEPEPGRGCARFGAACSGRSPLHDLSIQ